jgi:hypothetical protein
MCVKFEITGVLLKCSANALTLRPSAAVGELPDPPLWVWRLGSEEKTHPGGVIQLVSEKCVASKIEVAGRDRELARFLPRLSEVSEIPSDALANFLARPVR